MNENVDTAAMPMDVTDQEPLMPEASQVIHDDVDVSAIAVVVIDQETSVPEATQVIHENTDPTTTPLVVADQENKDSSGDSKASATKRSTKPFIACLDLLLSQNFDRVSSPCIVTATKYIQNILSDPSELKFRTINIANKAFQEKVLKAIGASELMVSMGFVQNPGSVSLLTNDSSAEFLQKILNLLEQAMIKLNIPEADRPKAKPVVQRVVPTGPVVEWDPYASSIVRTAPQPSRGGKSATEVQLEQLHAQRRNLEGTLESVERRTEVLMPHSDGSVASMQDYLNAENSATATNMEEEETGPSDSTLIARSLAGKMKGMKGEEEPMTTAAVRELRQLQKERVYSYTLLRVKFPDRVCIQGYFHIRHTVLDVYEWVYSCLNLYSEEKGGIKDTTNDNKKNQSGSNFFRLFELYTSPPRCVLHPYAKSSSEKESYSSSVNTTETSSGVKYLPLIEAHLVPAALIHLNWGPDHPEYKDVTKSMPSISMSASAASSSASASSSSEDTDSAMTVRPLIGQYLSQTLLSHASSKDSKESSTLTSAYPLGAALGPGPPGTTSTAGASTADGKSNNSEKTEGKEKSKPKWFKIGR